MSMTPTATAPHSVVASGASANAPPSKSNSIGVQDVAGPTSTNKLSSDHKREENPNSSLIPESSHGTPKVNDEEFIKKVVNKAVQEVIQDETYVHDATNQWTNRIVEMLVRSFVQTDRDNKYIGMFLFHYPIYYQLHHKFIFIMLLTCHPYIFVLRVQLPV